MPSPALKIIDELKLNSKSLFIDLGAGAGEEISVCLEKGVPIHSFEPNPVLYINLRDYYGPDNSKFVLHNLAAWNENSSRRLYAKGSFNDNGGCTLYKTKANVGKNFVEINTIDIGQYILNLDRKIDVLKIDTEGAEYTILDRLLESNAINLVDRIFIEDHSRKMPSKSWRQHRLEVIDKYKAINYPILSW